ARGEHVLGLFGRVSYPLPKLDVAGSNPVARSRKCQTCSGKCSGGTGRRWPTRGTARTSSSAHGSGLPVEKVRRLAAREAVRSRPSGVRPLGYAAGAMTRSDKALVLLLRVLGVGSLFALVPVF